MEEATSKAQILDHIKDERAKLEGILKNIPLGKMTLPFAGASFADASFAGDSDWSVKDTLAHLTAWEQLMLGWMRASERGETPDRPAPGESWDDLDGLNDKLHQAHKDSPLNEVLAGFHASYQQVLEMLNGLSEGDLFDPQRYAWRRGDPLWHMVAANTWWHYKEHRETIAAWLDAASH